MGRLTRRIRHTFGYPAAVAFLTVGSLFPLQLLRRFGRVSAQIAWLARQRDRRRTREHLRLAMPDQDQVWRRRVVRQLIAHTGDLLGEAAWLWSVSPEDLSARTRFFGLDQLHRARELGRGVVLITGHCGNWEWMNLALAATEFPLTVAAREVFDPRLDRLVQRLRGRFGGQTVVRGDRAGQKLVGALRRGDVVGLLIDQDIDAPGAFVEFFNRPAWTPSGAARLALRLKAPVVTGFCIRQPDGMMEIHLSPVWPVPQANTLDESAAQLTANLTAAIEAQIRTMPSQWPWFHRRWRRTRTEGQPLWRAEPDVVAWIRRLGSGDTRTAEAEPNRP